jgi:magnesium chelatase family protein
MDNVNLTGNRSSFASHDEQEPGNPQNDSERYFAPLKQAESPVYSIYSAVFHGVDPVPVEIQTCILRGLPNISIIGLPDTAIKEAKDRVRSALESSGFQIPLRNLIINLAPASIRKIGTQLDLPIALAILMVSNQILMGNVQDIFAAGELGLDGRVRSFKGFIPLLLSIPFLPGKIKIFPENDGSLAAFKKIQHKFSMQERTNELSTLNFGMDNVVWLRNLQNIEREINFYQTNSTEKVEAGFAEPVKNAREFPFEFTVWQKNTIAFSPIPEDVLKSWIRENGCLSEVKGQDTAKRALEIAATGMHNALFLGPPGCGKSMLAKRFPILMPPLPPEKILEVIRIHFLSTEQNMESILSGIPPFRSPHHTATEITLLGGGLYPKSGEISLSHNGILFLDELTEFRNSTLQALREPMENGYHTIHRLGHSYRFPCNFLLLAACNPCRCGYHLDPVRNCTCSNQIIRSHLAKINGPLIDRIDLEVEMPRPELLPLSSSKKNSSSTEIHYKVMEARRRAMARIKKIGGSEFIPNALLSKNMQEKVLNLKPGVDKLAREIYEKKSISLRSLDKTILISRSIADLDNSEFVTETQLMEAFLFKNLNSKYQVSF